MLGQLVQIVIPFHTGLHRSVSSMDEIMKFKFKHGEQGVQLCREASEKVNCSLLFRLEKSSSPFRRRGGEGEERGRRGGGRAGGTRLVEGGEGEEEGRGERGGGWGGGVKN